MDIDMRFDPERDELFRLVDKLKVELDINLELASPPDFIPAVTGWEDRSLFIDRYGRIDFYHFDPYSQALAKIERGHDQDLQDAACMVEHRLIDPTKLESLFASIEAQLYRYPAIRSDRFKRALEEFLSKQKRAE